MPRGKTRVRRTTDTPRARRVEWALPEMQTIHEWAKGQYCLDRGIEPGHHCCLEMAYAIAHPVEIVHQGPNRVLDWISALNEYMIPVSHDGYSGILIRYCPWRWKKLPESKRGKWYQILYSLGFDDPGEQEIPAEFNSDKWWRKKL